MTAQRSVPFASEAGQVVVAGEQLLFVNRLDPQQTFSIDRSNIVEANELDSILTVRTSVPVAGSQEHSFRLSAPSAIDFAAWAGQSPTQLQPSAGNEFHLEFDVREERTLFGDETGKLVIGEDEVRYISVTNSDRSFAWQYQDIEEFIRKDEDRIKIKSFAGDGYTFTLLGQALSPRDYREIIDRMAQTRRGS